MEPVFLTLVPAYAGMAIHRDQVERHGGHPGVRDLALLPAKGTRDYRQSALAMPYASFGGCFLHRDLPEMAAAYLFHIVRNHPFVDGNKRTGAVAALVFLALNGLDCAADEAAFEEAVRAVADGRWGKAEMSAFLRHHCVQPR